MSPAPRSSLSDDYAVDLACPICGQVTLKVTHVERLPDFVSCGNCESAFLVEEGGDRVMFGKIQEAYPQTQRFALRSWAFIEAVARHAASERPPADSVQPHEEDILGSAVVPIPTEPDTPLPPQRPIPLEPEAVPEMAESTEPPDVPEPPMRFTPDDLLEFDEADELAEAKPLPGLDDMQLAVDTEPYEDYPPGAIDLEEPAWEAPRFERELPAEEIPEAPAEGLPTPVTTPPLPTEEEDEIPEFKPRETDPPPGQRYRVVIRGDKVQFPKRSCAHCMRTPVRGRLATVGTLPEGQGIGQRKATTFNLPLCSDCRKRARQAHEEEKNDRLQAYLLSTLSAMVLLVAALAWGVDLQDQPQSGVLILAILAILGFSIPAYVLLGRIRAYPPPPDAAYVRSTLLVPEDIQGLETAFEFRNRGYAAQFHAANEAATLGKVSPVKDRTLPGI
ncbi:MAG: hypothetical protein GTO14_19390 [Anaerolineales bacterium]|nr:hypothetical protein [Anaerolineales bacterium]